MIIIKTRKNLNIPEKGARYFPHTLDKVYPNTGITYSHQKVCVDLGFLTWKDGHHMLGEKSHLSKSMSPFFKKVYAHLHRCIKQTCILHYV